MAVKVVNVPVAWTLQCHQAIFAQEMGQMDAIKRQRTEEAEEAERQLNDLLESGYRIQASHTIEITDRTLIAFVLWKSDIPF